MNTSFLVRVKTPATYPPHEIPYVLDMSSCHGRLTLILLLMLCPADPVSADGTHTSQAELDRVAYAVDGAESSHGKDLSMWRPDPAGPQGPMQVSEKAAIDVGGGNRFDITQNRVIGRAYLSLLYRRYRNWPDAITAYNWGPRNFDSWVKKGRPLARLASGVSHYRRRVLTESGICNAAVSIRSGCVRAPDEVLTASDNLRTTLRGGTESSLNRNLRRAEALAKLASRGQSGSSSLGSGHALQNLNREAGRCPENERCGRGD